MGPVNKDDRLCTEQTGDHHKIKCLIKLQKDVKILKINYEMIAIVATITLFIDYDVYWIVFRF